MNRRTSIRSILALSALGISSFSAYKWFDLHQKISLSQLTDFKLLITELAETIIPETDTPGAKSAGVHNYIINVLHNCTSKVEQNKFLNGLESVTSFTQNKFNKPFERCNSVQRTEILKHFEENDTYRYQILNKINNKLVGRPFFTLLKQLTIEGYCSSELGASQGLSYDYIPGSYIACMPLKSNQKSWATK
ncbi:gluconate 2-dehydrogenase subunit 3 family protein [Pedobacter lithocola]|uniref:Gluconate 2-dehydrogenase subunit 3 family protein n=1 Tax=Pedobacter lithocola TaxID=1908239 RepID=A0ABV8P945_9SPHI